MMQDGFPCCCSFCGRSEKEVDVIITGPTTCICNLCVQECQEIIEKKGRKSDVPSRDIVRGGTPDDSPGSVGYPEGHPGGSSSVSPRGNGSQGSYRYRQSSEVRLDGAPDVRSGTLPYLVRTGNSRGLMNPEINDPAAPEPGAKRIGVDEYIHLRICRKCKQIISWGDDVWWVPVYYDGEVRIGSHVTTEYKIGDRFYHYPKC